jgi:hypothetical protein
MASITSKYLEAALIDQIVAGQFSGLVYAFASVPEPGGWVLGVVVANEKGYSPVRGKVFTTSTECEYWVEGLNAHIGRSPESVMSIVGSSMGMRVEIVH